MLLIPLLEQTKIKCEVNGIRVNETYEQFDPEAYPKLILEFVKTPEKFKNNFKLYFDRIQTKRIEIPEKKSISELLDLEKTQSSLFQNDSIFLLQTWLELAQTLRNENQLDESKKFYEKALKNIQPNQEAMKFIQIQLMEDLSDLLVTMEKSEEAEKMRQNLLTIKEQLFGKISPSFAFTLYKLAESRLSLSIFDQETLNLLSECADIQEKTIPQSQKYFDTLKQLESFFKRVGQTEKVSKTAERKKKAQFLISMGDENWIQAYSDIKELKFLEEQDLAFANSLLKLSTHLRIDMSIVILRMCKTVQLVHLKKSDPKNVELELEYGKTILALSTKLLELATRESYPEALPLSKKCVEIFLKNSNNNNTSTTEEMKCQILSNMIRCLYKVNQFEEGMEFAKELFSITTRQNKQTSAIYKNSLEFMANGNYNLSQFDEALKFFEILNSDFDSHDARKSIADIFIKQKKYSQALELLEIIVKSKSSDFATMEGITGMNTMIDQLEQNNQFEESLSIFNKNVKPLLFEMLEKEKPDSKSISQIPFVARTLERPYSLLIKMGKLDDALKLNDENSKLIESYISKVFPKVDYFAKSYPSDKIDSLLKMGTTLVELKQFEKATFIFQKSKDEWKRIGNQQKENNCSLKLARVLKLEGKLEESLKKFEETEQKSTNPFERVTFLEEISDTLGLLNRHQEALDILQKILEIAGNKPEFGIQKRQSFLRVAKCYENLDRIPNAVSKYEEIEKMEREMKHPLFEILSQFGSFLLRQKRFSEALLKFEECEKISKLELEKTRKSGNLLISMDLIISTLSELGRKDDAIKKQNERNSIK